MKIIAFAQAHNELSNGHLENWFKSLSFCDQIYIFDNASTDGSREFYKKFLNVHVIFSDTNRFPEEILFLMQMLNKVYKKYVNMVYVKILTDFVCDIIICGAATSIIE
jgi:hypothetical protein